MRLRGNDVRARKPASLQAWRIGYARTVRDRGARGVGRSVRSWPGVGARPVIARLGVELGPRAIRAVRVEGWPRRGTRVVEIEWDPDSPDEAVGTLAEHLGAVRRIAVAVDLPLLFIKRVKLPALPAAERRNILRLEPERFFAVRSEDLVSAVRDDDLVFAVKET